MHLIVPYVIGRILGTVVECGKRQCILGLAQWKNCVVDVDQSVGGAGHSAALNPHYIVLSIDTPNAQSLNDTPTITHVTRHLGAGPDATFFTSATDVARTSMCFRHTMGSRHALEAVTLDHTLKTMIDAENAEKRQMGTTRFIYFRVDLRLAAHIDKFTNFEMTHIQGRAGSNSCLRRDNEACQILFGHDTRITEYAAILFGQQSWICALRTDQKTSVFIKSSNIWSLSWRILLGWYILDHMIIDHLQQCGAYAFSVL